MILEEKDLKEAIERVRQGQVFIYPTDTVCGIGCDALNEEAVKRIFEIKKREQKPLSVAFANAAQLKEFTEYESKLPPGPYTLIVPRGKIPKTVSCGLDTVGARIPASPYILKLILSTGPIVTTSANFSGEPPVASLEEIPQSLKNKVDFVFDTKQRGSGKPSEIITATGERLR
jgi:L-threonylcarbamoyladenylate synthase